MLNSRLFTSHHMGMILKVVARKVNHVSRFLKPFARSTQAEQSTSTEEEPCSVHTTVQEVLQIVLVSSLTRI